MYSSAYFGVLSMELVSYYPSGMYTFNEAHMFFWKTCRPQATCNKNYSPNMNHAALYHTYLKLLSWPDHLTHKKQVSFLQLLLLLRNQGPGHTPQMHHSLKAYCATLFPPLCFRRSHFRHQVSPCPHDARDPSSERWNFVG